MSSALKMVWTMTDSPDRYRVVKPSPRYNVLHQDPHGLLRDHSAHVPKCGEEVSLERLSSERFIRLDRDVKDTPVRLRTPGRREARHVGNHSYTGVSSAWRPVRVPRSTRQTRQFLDNTEIGSRLLDRVTTIIEGDLLRCQCTVRLRHSGSSEHYRDVGTP